MLGPSWKRGYIGNTDADWYRFLRGLDTRRRAEGVEGLAEINFWKPSGRPFKALAPGEPFFLRLKAPVGRIAGFGFFMHYTVLPAWLAWETFGVLNGAPSREVFYELIGRYLARGKRGASVRDAVARHPIGCVLLAQPVFLDEAQWVASPSDWKRNIVAGKGVSLESAEGKRLLAECLVGLSEQQHMAGRPRAAEEAEGLWAASAARVERLVKIRLGQGTFRSMLLDAYDRACAVTREHSLPVLEAAHIRPFAECQQHDVRNGLLLRTDIHRLFDRSYVTVTPDHRFEVSPRLREEWHNGRTYYALRGQRLHLPERAEWRPDPQHLRWHNEHVFLAS